MEIVPKPRYFPRYKLTIITKDGETRSGADLPWWQYLITPAPICYSEVPPDRKTDIILAKDERFKRYISFLKRKGASPKELKLLESTCAVVVETSYVKDLVFDEGRF